MNDAPSNPTQLSPLASKANQHVDQSWTDQKDELASLTLESALADISLEELAGAQAIKTEDKLAFPLIFEYSTTTRRTSYRRGEAAVQLPSGRAPSNSSWLEIDPRMSLRRALDLYGVNLLAFERLVRHTSLEILVLPVRERHDQTLRVLVRRPATP
jgi:hypothetical protein